VDCPHGQSMARSAALVRALDSVFTRVRAWVKADVFKRLFDAVSGEPDLEYAMVDATIVKVHRHGQGAKEGLCARPSAVAKAA
jgi:transposase